MTNKEKYKKELLDKFLAKNISADERHELEKFALDDPFLFEALNGFAQAKGEHHADINELRARLFTSSAKKKRRSIVPYGIAASLLVVLGLSLWLTDFGEADNHKKSMASSTEISNEVSTSADNQELAEAVSTQDEASGVDAEVPAIVKTKQSAASDINTKKETPRPLASKAKKSREALGSTNDKSSEMKSAVPSPQTIEEPEFEMNREEDVSGDYEVEAVGEPMDVGREVVASVPEEEENVNQVLNKSERSVGTQGAQVDQVLSESVVTATPKKEKAIPKAAYADAPQNTGLSAFDVHFIDLVKKNLTRKEQRDLNGDVELQFAIINGVISEFKVVPSQGKRLDQMLQSFVQSGAKLLPEQNALLMVYDIGF